MATKKISSRIYPKVSLYIKLLATIIAVGLLGLVVFMTINSSRPHKDNTATQTPQDSTQTNKQKLDTLKTNALAKLQEGNKTGGLADLRSALTIAKENKLADETIYFEQQIDYAEHTDFTSKNTAPAVLPSDKGKPGYISR